MPTKPPPGPIPINAPSVTEQFLVSTLPLFSHRNESFFGFFSPGVFIVPGHGLQFLPSGHRAANVEFTIHSSFSLSSFIPSAVAAFWLAGGVVLNEMARRTPICTRVKRAPNLYLPTDFGVLSYRDFNSTVTIPPGGIDKQEDM